MSEPWQIAMRYLDTPFLHRGRTARGVDCYGLLVLVAQELGWALQDAAYYSAQPLRPTEKEQLSDYLLANFGEPVERPLQPNDVIALRLRPRFIPSMCGIVAPHPHGLGFVSAGIGMGGVRFQRLDQKRLGQLAGVYPWPAKY